MNINKTLQVYTHMMQAVHTDLRLGNTRLDNRRCKEGSRDEHSQVTWRTGTPIFHE